ncbi:MAG: diguanylate cyclase, partial [Blastocatellia bacterium]
ELDETLSLFTEKIREFVPFDTCLVYLMDECGNFAEAKHADGKNGEALKGNRIDVGEGATGYVLQMSKSVENVDPALDFGFSHPDFSRDYTAMASIPLINDEKLIGALSLYSSVLVCYDDEHLRLLETVSHIASDAITRALQLAEAESYALTDPMTGLPNSRSLQNHFEKERKRASRAGGTFQLLVLDLDGFKAVNDTFGHKAGDTMLREVGQAIHGQLRDYDFLARYGGDEFVAIIPDTETADVLDLSRRIEKAVCDFKMQIDERVFASVGVSIGSASFPNHGETFDQMIVAADKAMYLTKEIHRQRTRSPFGDVFTSLEIPRDQLLVETADSSSKVSQNEMQDSILLELDENDIISSSAIN